MKKREVLYHLYLFKSELDELHEALDAYKGELKRERIKAIHLAKPDKDNAEWIAEIDKAFAIIEVIKEKINKAVWGN